MNPFRTLSALAAAGMMLLALNSPALHAATLFWDGGIINIPANGDGAGTSAAGNWDTTIQNWDVGAVPHVAWNNVANANDTASFFANSSYAVTVNSNINLGGIGTTWSGATRVLSINSTTSTLNFSPGSIIDDTTGSAGNYGVFSITAGISGAPNLKIRQFSNTAHTLNPSAGLSHGLGTVIFNEFLNATGDSTLALQGANTTSNTINGIQIRGNNSASSFRTFVTKDSTDSTWSVGNVVSAVSANNDRITLRGYQGLLKFTGDIQAQTIEVGNAANDTATVELTKPGATLDVVSIIMAGGILKNSSGGALSFTTSAGDNTNNNRINNSGIRFEGGDMSFSTAHRMKLNTPTATLNVQTSTQNITFNGVVSHITSGNALTKDGPGTLTLANSGNTFNGQLTVANGTLSIPTINNASANGTLGNNALAVILGSSGNTGTLKYTGTTASSTKPFSLASSGTGAFDIATAAEVLTLSGVIDGSGALTKAGSGTLLLTNANNSYTGNTTINAGILEIGGSGRLGSGSYAGDISIASLSTFRYNSTAAQTLSGVVSGAGAVVKNGAGSTLLLTNANNAYTGNTTITAGTLEIGGSGRLGSGSYAGDISIASLSTFHYNSTAAQTLSGVISGAGAVVKNGAGSTLILTNANNSYTGTTTINAGTLEIGGSGRLGSGSYAGNISIASSSTFRYNSTANQTLSGLVSGSGVVVKDGGTSSNLLLTNTSNSYSGGTNINAGFLEAVGNGALGTTGAITFGGGTLVQGAGNTEDFSSRFATNGTAAIIVDPDNKTITYASPIAANNTGGFVKVGPGTIKLTAASTYTGPTDVRSGILEISNTLASATVRAGQSSANGGNAGARMELMGNNLLPSNVAVTVDGQGANFLDLNGFNQTISTLTLGSFNGGSRGQVVGSGTSTLTVTGGVTSLNHNNGNGGISVPFLNLNGSTQTFTVQNGSAAVDLDISSVIQNGGLTMNGAVAAATLGLSGANTYSGPTQVNTGVLQLDNKLALQNSPLDTSGTGTVALNAGVGTYTIGGLTGSKNLAAVITTGLANMTTLELNPLSGPFTYSGNIAANGAMGLDKKGGGTQILSGTNTYTGATNINVGTLLLNGTHTGAGAYTVASGATLGGTGSTDAALTVQSGGHLAPGQSPGLMSFGTVTLTPGANYDVDLWGTIVGTGYDRTNVTAGVLDVTGAILNLDFNGFFPAPGDTFTIFDKQSAGAVTDTFAGLLNNAVFSQSGRKFGIRYDSDTASVYSSGNDITLYSLPAAATPGTLYASRSWDATPPFTAVDGDEELALMQTGYVAYDAFGTTNAISTALTNYPGYAGPIVVNGGTFAAAPLAGGGAVQLQLVDGLTANDVTIQALSGDAGDSIVTDFHNGGTGGNLIAESGSFNGIISGTGSLTKNTGGTLTLGGANTYSGSTTVNGGTLELLNTGSLQNSAVTVNGGTFLQSGGTNNVTGGTGTGDLDITGGAYTLAGGTLNFGDTVGAGAHHAVTTGTPGTDYSELNIAAGASFNFAGGTLMDISEINPGSGTFTQSDGNFVIGQQVSGAPPDYAAITVINGNFTMVDGVLSIDVFGPELTPLNMLDAEPIDLLIVAGVADLDGLIDLDFEGGFPVVFGDVFTLVKADEFVIGPNFGLSEGFLRIIFNGPGMGYSLQAIVPEPGTVAMWSLLALAAGGFAVRMRGRRRG